MLLKKTWLILCIVVMLLTVLSWTKYVRSELIFAFQDRNQQSEQDQKLFNRIKQSAEKLNTAPIDAKIDPVWKAIPGYNGLRVDLNQTFKWAKQLGVTAETGNIPFVYEEVAPSIQLEQLEPAPIYRGNSHKPMVAFMINVAWGNEYIPILLKILEEENVHATFFLDGTWLSQNADLAKEIMSHGHEMSNHAYSHRNMSELTRSQATEEIVKTQVLLKQQLGVENTLFAPPSGDFDHQTVRIAAELSLKTVLWTLDTVDWKKPSPEAIVRSISNRLEPGSLILMHPTEASSKALSGMIQEVKRRGYALGTVSELLSSNRVPLVEPFPFF